MDQVSARSSGSGCGGGTQMLIIGSAGGRWVDGGYRSGCVRAVGRGMSVPD
jgi:hypothetical protein